ncbi:MAG: hypothetical protein H5U40_09695, partial [Polyangiaceae bacterium]|nr:hypothetical protein [Polyangiaceae bacterium]
GGGVAVRVDTIASSAPDGIFGAMLTRSSDPDAAWVVTVRGRLANGKDVSRQVVLDGRAGALPGTNGLDGIVDDGLTEAERAERYGRVGDRVEQTIQNGAAGRVALGTHVAIDIPAGALQGQKKVSITHLSASELPVLDPGMINVTAPFAHGYEFLPYGERFNAAVTITLPYQEALIPEGYTVHDIETWYFDEDLDRWARLARDEVDPSRGVVKSLTEHFTVMVNAIVVTPEHPQASSFDGNRIQGLEAAHPGAGITMIEAPTANSRGDASVQYPLVVPPGRRGAQPGLALTYSSSAGNGWVGVGWDVGISSISVDTRFGAPRYRPNKETETYLLDGEQLAPTAHRSEFEP